MKDKIIQIEVVLNFLNTLFGKAVYFKDANTISELSTLRRDVYYSNNFDYESFLKRLQALDVNLKDHE